MMLTCPTDMSQKIIDRSWLPLENHIARYLEYGEKLDESDTETLAKEEKSTYFEIYEDVYKKGDDLLMEIGEYVEYLDDLGIEKKIVPQAELVMDEIAEYPDKFIPEVDLLGIPTNRVTERVEKLERLVTEHDYGGVRIEPYEEELKQDHRRYYPIYQTAEELDIVALAHCSANFDQEKSIRYGHPHNLEAVCQDFPDLTVVASHGTWPWVAEGTTLAWKHPNLYIDIGAMRAKYIGSTTAWAPLVEYGSGIIKDKILFGSGWPLIDEATQIEDVKNLGLSEEVERKWFYENAATAYGV